MVPGTFVNVHFKPKERSKRFLNVHFEPKKPF